MAHTDIAEAGHIIGRIQPRSFIEAFDENFVDDSKLYSRVTVETEIPD